MTIVELLIASFVMAIVFAALAATVISSFTAITNNETRVRATALANEVIEEMATIRYARLGLFEDDFLSSETLDPDNPPKFDDNDELVVLLSDGDGVPQHQQPISRDGVDFEVERWVTWFEEDGGPDLKRMVVIVTWEVAGRERSIRTEGLRAPDPVVSDLVVSFLDLVNRNELEEPDGVGLDGDFRNTGLVEATIRVGEESSTVFLSYIDRIGNQQTLTSPTTGGGTVERTFQIANSGPFPHGPVTFTATASTTDGQVASDSNVIRFYQDLVLQVPSVSTAPLEICEDGSLSGGTDVTVDATVFGLTPGEASRVIASDGDDITHPALGLTWQVGTPSDDSLFFFVPPVQAQADPQSKAYGGDFTFVVPADEFAVPASDLPAEVGETGVVTFRVAATRRVDPESVETNEFDDEDVADAPVVNFQLVDCSS